MTCDRGEAEEDARSDAMILDQFRVWARDASSAGRAQGLRFIIDAYLLDDLGDHQADAVQLLTEYLDDPSPVVRKAMAEGLAHSAYAPRHLVTSLADDQADIAAVILEHSPILRDAELIDWAALGETPAQVAIASRSPLSEPVAAALAEVATLPAALALLRNRSVQLPLFSLRRLVERHGIDGELREFLLKRDDLPAIIRLELVAAATRALGGFVVDQHWLSAERMAKVALEQRDRAAVTVGAASTTSKPPVRDLAAFLRRSGQLTTSLMLRAILSGQIDLVVALLSELTDLPMTRTAALVRHSRSAGFAALYRRSGLPTPLLPIFRIALAVGKHIEAGSTEMSLAAVQQVLAGCDKLQSDEFGSVVALLRRFEAEAARDAARSATQSAGGVDMVSSAWDHREQGIAAIELALMRDLDMPGAVLAADSELDVAGPDMMIEEDGRFATALIASSAVELAVSNIEPEAVATTPALDAQTSGSLIALRPVPRYAASYDVDLAALEIELLAA